MSQTTKHGEVHHRGHSGGEVDGVTGLVRPPVSRLMALASLTASTASLGFATVELLELVAGSWVAVMINLGLPFGFCPGR